MSKKKWYEIWGYGQFKSEGKYLLAKVVGEGNAIQIKDTFEKIGYKEVEVR